MQVLVTPRAEKNFDIILGYIKDKWGEKTAKQFIRKTNELFKLLQNYPTIGQVENGALEDSNFLARQNCFTP